MFMFKWGGHFKLLRWREVGEGSELREGYGGGFGGRLVTYKGEHKKRMKGFYCFI